MTKPALHTVTYLGQIFDVTRVHGTGLFDPRDQGYQPAMDVSFCWHGFLCAYRVAGAALMLDELRLFPAAEPPAFFGVRPQPSPHGWVDYPALRAEVPFTGTVLLGRDQVPDLSDRMIGTPLPWTYAEVIELTFEGGRLTGNRDRSAEGPAIRERGDEEVPRREQVSIMDMMRAAGIDWPWPDER